MAIFPMAQNDMDGVGNLGCDGVADVQNLTEYAKTHSLKPGSNCYCIDTGDLYMMKSDFTWKKQ